MMRAMRRPLPVPVQGLLLGAALGATHLPLDWSFLAFVPLAALLLWAASADTARGVAGRVFWAGSGLMAVHLWWLTAFLGKIFSFPPAGVLAFALFALEGLFLAVMALIVARLTQHRLGRVWALAGGWVVLEWLRTLGPLAFPWPMLGYTLLPTPMIQIADLGGVLLGSALVAATAAALVSFWLDRRAPLIALSAVWIAAIAYGVTRQPAAGAAAQALVLRTDFDSFDRVTGLNPDAEFQRQLELSAARRPGEVLIWSESAVQSPASLARTPANGLYGLSSWEPRSNRVVSWDGVTPQGTTDKARPVPFGEYFPLQETLQPFWTVIQQGVGFVLPPNLPPAQDVRPLPLSGVLYGAYVCYDSVFSWVARKLTNRGAQVLVNVSNDGWYEGWGVQQHFMMGRVRAIENRRWVLRSVNRGIAAAVDDLGRPRQVLGRGEGALHARYRVLSGQTVYGRVGDWPALLLAAAMIAGGSLAGRRR